MMAAGFPFFLCQCCQCGHIGTILPCSDPELASTNSGQSKSQKGQPSYASSVAEAITRHGADLWIYS